MMPLMRSFHFLDNEALHAIVIPLTLTICLSEQPVQHKLDWSSRFSAIN